MTFTEIAKEIHNSHCEYHMLAYLASWVGEDNDRLIIENCKLNASRDLLRKFNDAKWHNELIGTLIEL